MFGSSKTPLGIASFRFLDPYVLRDADTDCLLRAAADGEIDEHESGAASSFRDMTIYLVIVLHL
jgi:hypothetical protein